MSKYETNQHQAAPNAPIETFSNKPLKIDGHTIYPGWNWSNFFRKVVREQFAKPRDTIADREGRADLYRTWYEAKHGYPWDDRTDYQTPLMAAE